MSKATAMGLILAAIHLAAYVATLQTANDDGWHRLVFMGLWQAIDFPVGLAAIIGFWTGYWDWIAKTFGASSSLAFLLYPTHVADGFLGTVWWFLLPRFIAMARAQPD